LQVIPDLNYAGMWRIKRDDWLSDMANLTWVRDGRIYFSRAKLLK
jgi:hypothetical protein